MTRATLRYDQSSPTKVRQVLNLIRGLDVAEAREILRFSQRGASGLKFMFSPKRTAPISAQPSGSPRCPELQAWTASMASPRASLAAVASAVVFMVGNISDVVNSN